MNEFWISDTQSSLPFLVCIIYNYFFYNFQVFPIPKFKGKNSSKMYINLDICEQ